MMRRTVMDGKCGLAGAAASNGCRGTASAKFGVLLADGNPALLEECKQVGEIEHDESDRYGGG